MLVVVVLVALVVPALINRIEVEPPVVKSDSKELFLK